VHDVRTVLAQRAPALLTARPLPSTRAMSDGRAR
jgi:hypothetical protein